jgi:hypothetical protein
VKFRMDLVPQVISQNLFFRTILYSSITKELESREVGK